jgi:hypothetical protein
MQVTVTSAMLLLVGSRQSGCTVAQKICTAFDGRLSIAMQPGRDCQVARPSPSLGTRGSAPSTPWIVSLHRLVRNGKRSTASVRAPSPFAADLVRPTRSVQRVRGGGAEAHPDNRRRPARAHRNAQSCTECSVLKSRTPEGAQLIDDAAVVDRQHGLIEVRGLSSFSPPELGPLALCRLLGRGVIRRGRPYVCRRHS